MTIDPWDTLLERGAGLVERASTASRVKVEYRTCVLYERLLKPEQKAIIDLPRIIDAIMVDNQRIDNGAELQQAVPFVTIAADDLHGVDLHGADLAEAILTQAVLAGADLHGATLADANLRGADLAQASLARAARQARDAVTLSSHEVPFLKRDVSGMARWAHQSPGVSPATIRNYLRYCRKVGRSRTPDPRLRQR